MLKHKTRILFPSRGLALLVMSGVIALTPGIAQAQDDESEVDEIDLVSKDGVSLKATYYHGTSSKDAAAVILIHGEGGGRSDLGAVAKSLQGEGHHVLAPDLRGHGDSTKAQGVARELDYQRMRPAEFLTMVNDIEACKKFFLEKNNDGELNIENLCIVGAGPLGSVLSFIYTAEDWRTRPFGRFKQGQDVKAVIMFSPTEREKTMQTRTYLRDPSVGSDVSYFLIVNNTDAAQSRTADRMEEALKRASADKEDDKRVIRLNVQTRLEGAKILQVQEADEILRQINVFIKLRVIDKEHGWNERRIR